MARHDWRETILNALTNNGEHLVRIDHNRNTRIENVNVSIFLSTPAIQHDFGCLSLRSEFSGLAESGIQLYGIKEIEIFHVDKLRAFTSIVQKNNLQPIIRLRGLFSAFSTLRENSDKDDMSQLELEEKKIFVDLAKRGCIFKLILNLDIMKAVVCGYGKEEIARRVGDLCNECDLLNENKNFQIAIDTTMTNYEPVWTIDEILINKQMMFGEKSNYGASYWDSNMIEIREFNTKFDNDFALLQSQMYSMWKLLSISSISSFINFVTSDWISKHAQLVINERGCIK